MTEREIELEINNKSSHSYLINLVTKHLESLKSRQDAGKFNRKILALKKSREKADYKQYNFTSQEANQAKDNAIEMREYLKTTFL